MRIAILLTALIVTGCGWHLRGFKAQQLPAAIEVVSAQPFGPLSQAFRGVLKEQGIRSQANSSWQVHLSQESLSKRTVAVTSIGSASQYELSLSVEFQFVHLQQGMQGLPQRVSTTRTFDFDPDNTTAKAQEEATLLEEMRLELSHRVLQLFPRDTQ